MNPTTTFLACPSCGHTFESGPGPAGWEFPCPACRQTLRLPEPDIAPGATPSELASPPNAPTRAALPWAITAVISLVGAGGGWWVFGGAAGMLVGVLAGFLIGRTVRGIVLPGEDDPGLPSFLSSARWSLILSIGAWVAAGPLWALALGADLLRGEGEGLVLIFVLPFTGLCWLIGGPLASTAARRALKQIETGQLPESDRPMAQHGLILSRLMTFTLLGSLLWLLILISA